MRRKIHPILKIALRSAKVRFPALATLQNSALTSGYEEASSGQGFRAAAIDDATGGTSAESEQQHFHWARALTESFTFLMIEQAYVVHTGFRSVVSENGVPFNHYWRDYKQSLSEWLARDGTMATPTGSAMWGIRFRGL
jgi:hypothetical protein